MLLLESRSMVYDNPMYESLLIEYDYLNAVMISNNNNGFVWDGVEKIIHLIPRIAINFITITAIISNKDATFSDFVETINTDLNQRNQFRNHSNI